MCTSFAAWLRQKCKAILVFSVCAAHMLAFYAPTSPGQTTTPEDVNALLDDLGDLEQEVFIAPPQKTERSFSDIVFEDFSGQLGFSRVAGDIQRESQFFDLNYNVGPEWLRLGLRGRVSKTSITYTLKLRNTLGGIHQTEPFTLSNTLTDSQSEFAEAYLQSRLGPLLLRVGKQTIVLGQFDLFSPIDFALPLRSGASGGGNLSKVDNRLPQNAASLAWFVLPWMELQYHYFPKLEVDPFLEQIFLSQKTQLSYTSASTSPTGFEAKQTDIRIQKPSPEKEQQTVSRLLFYPSWGVFGFTYYKGYDTNDVKNVGTLNRLSNGTDYVDFHEIHPQVVARETRGFEMAVRSGKWTWKLEVTRSPSLQDIGGFFDRQYSVVASDPRRDEFLDWVRTQNDNKLYLEVEETLGAFGVDAEPGRWRINLAIYAFSEKYAPGQERGRELDDAVFGEQSTTGSVVVFPSLNVSRYVGKDQEAFWGVALGIVNAGQGGIVYFNQLVFDGRLRWGVALEVVEYFNDFALDEAAPSNNYERETETAVGLRYGMAYLF